MLLLYKAFVCQLYWCMQTKFHFKILKVDEFHERLSNSMDQFRNDVTLWVKHLRGRYDAIFIEPENVNKISWAVKMSNICIICQNPKISISFHFLRNLKYEKNGWKPLNWLKTIWKRQVEFALFISLVANVRKMTFRLSKLEKNMVQRVVR